MSDTPRTDELAKRDFITDGVWIRHARELERENAALRAALDQQANYQRELRADRDRLDWLAVTDVWFDEPATESYTPETFRAEIDRKMKEAQP